MLERVYQLRMKDKSINEHRCVIGYWISGGSIFLENKEHTRFRYSLSHVEEFVIRDLDSWGIVAMGRVSPDGGLTINPV